MSVAVLYRKGVSAEAAQAFAAGRDDARLVDVASPEAVAGLETAMPSSVVVVWDAALVADRAATASLGEVLALGVPVLNVATAGVTAPPLAFADFPTFGEADKVGIAGALVRGGAGSPMPPSAPAKRRSAAQFRGIATVVVAVFGAFLTYGVLQSSRLTSDVGDMQETSGAPPPRPAVQPPGEPAPQPEPAPPAPMPQPTPQPPSVIDPVEDGASEPPVGDPAPEPGTPGDPAPEPQPAPQPAPEPAPPPPPPPPAPVTEPPPQTAEEVTPELKGAPSSGVPVAVIAAAAAVVGGLATWGLIALFQRRRRAGLDMPMAQGVRVSGPPLDPMANFISYNKTDSSQVTNFVSDVEKSGAKCWMFERDQAAATQWAGEIVRALRNSERVIVFLTPRSCASPHVCRELTLADRFRKPIVPVLLEPCDPPDDVVYFLASLQELRVFEVGEEAARRLLREQLATA